MVSRHTKYILIILACVLVLLMGFPVIIEKHYMLVSFLIIILTFLPFAIGFSHEKRTTRELVMIAILGAVAAVSRVPFAPLPSVQPSTFVIIISGVVLGPQTGFVVGALTAIVSNIFLGQGPWTPWQMYAWGMIGLLAGYLRNTWVMNNKAGQCIYGFIVGILFGWFMNIWVIFSLGQPVNWQTITIYNTASILFDLAHSFSNIFFLIVFSHSWIKTLHRFKRKYGLFPEISS